MAATVVDKYIGSLGFSIDLSTRTFSSLGIAFIIGRMTGSLALLRRGTVTVEWRETRRVAVGLAQSRDIVTTSYLSCNAV